MSNFKSFADQIKSNFDLLQQRQLFKSALSGDDLWDIYIGSFKPSDNPIFRDPQSTTHNCNLDKNFIRRYGNVVAIDENYEIITMWNVMLSEDSPYYNSCKNMSNALKNAAIKDIFFETYDELDRNLNYESVKKNQEVYRLGIETNYKTYTQEEVDKYGVVEVNKA